MWHTNLRYSQKYQIGITTFYVMFTSLIIVLCQQTEFDNLIFVMVIILVIEWWKSYCVGRLIRGELALFYDIDELYWCRQRWVIIKKPICLRYVIIIHLVAKRKRKSKVLVLIDDSFTKQDWHSLHYFLRQFVKVS